jgi:hypothetical protein
MMVVQVLSLVVPTTKLDLEANLLFICLTPIGNKRGLIMVDSLLGPTLGKDKPRCRRG